MQFPDPNETLRSNVLWLVVGVFMLLLSLALVEVLWPRRKHSFGRRQRQTLTKDARRGLVFSMWILLLGGAMYIGVACSNLLNPITPYELDPNEIAEIRVVRLERWVWVKEHNYWWRPVTGPETLSDRQLLREGFRRLEQAKPVSQAGFGRDGRWLYRIQFKFAGRRSYSNRYLTVFRNVMSEGSDPYVSPFYGVVPHVGSDIPYSGNAFGSYASPEFYEWLVQHVEPRFEDPKPQPRNERRTDQPVHG